MALGTRSNLLRLPIGEAAPGEVNVVVEIASGSRNKYEYDPRLDIFRLDRTLHSPMLYPGDYGFVPRTIGRDGEPLDVLVLVSQPSFPGCLLVARPIGGLALIDEGKRDDKILAVPVGEPDYDEVHEYTDVSPHELRKIEHFFETYKLLEGKATRSEGWCDAGAARDLIADAANRFEERYAASERRA
jgi:inorganic pyrophosphatase